MSVAAAQAQQFFAEIAADGSVWTVKDGGGFPAPKNPSGKRAMPFWSKESRAQKIIDNIPAYAGFTPYQLHLSEFVERWLPDLDKDGLLIGINWSGSRAAGYDMTPTDVRARINYQQS